MTTKRLATKAPQLAEPEDFKDYPKNEFNSEEEAKQYIESKFGTIS